MSGATTSGGYSVGCFVSCAVVVPSRSALSTLRKRGPRLGVLLGAHLRVCRRALAVPHQGPPSVPRCQDLLVEVDRIGRVKVVQVLRGEGDGRTRDPRRLLLKEGPPLDGYPPALG